MGYSEKQIYENKIRALEAKIKQMEQEYLKETLELGVLYKAVASKLDVIESTIQAPDITDAFKLKAIAAQFKY